MTLTVAGSQIVATTSNGTSFVGLADDVKTKSFSQVSWDETVIVSVPSPVFNTNHQLITPIDIKIELNNPNIDTNSFVSNPVPVQLIPRNGVVVFPAGTPLNLDLGGTGTPNAIKTLVRYSYQIPNILGDDTTMGSQMVTVWFQRMLFETDQFEVNQQYNVNSNLFINEKGLFTTRQITPNAPCVAICTAPPTAIHSTLQALLL